ncbi:MAG: hypothetical protein HY248_05015 [Fimbriimonas ginsengisoli]|uniref:Uncharacterized protein n=1 Tax=Fimbriimonas ginsengisoli TaxID=1005039 RepID=A0A931LW33_FIMGI|nr:hypothetical protein [Fimbriimonas ginsengisoli]MBI3721896.1 hypothetical protein [Fimbriimonas ginsengisoli]
MSLRRLALGALCVVPTIPLLCLAVAARIRIEAFEAPKLDATSQSRVKAYREVVVKSETHLVSAKRSADVSIRLADDWIADHRRGKLRDLEPVTAEGSFNRGPRAEILRTYQSLSDLLLLHARRAARRGDLDAVASLTRRSLEISEILKYSDVGAAGVCSLQQRRAVRLLEGCLPGNATARSNLATWLADFQSHQRPIEPVILRARFLALRDERQERVIAALASSGQPTSDTGYVAQTVAWDGTGTDQAMKVFVVRVRVAIASQDALHRHLNGLVARLTSPVEKSD